MEEGGFVNVVEVKNGLWKIGVFSVVRLTAAAAAFSP